MTLNCQSRPSSTATMMTTWARNCWDSLSFVFLRVVEGISKHAWLGACLSNPLQSPESFCSRKAGFRRMITINQLRSQTKQAPAVIAYGPTDLCDRTASKTDSHLPSKKECDHQPSCARIPSSNKNATICFTRFWLRCEVVERDRGRHGDWNS